MNEVAVKHLTTIDPVLSELNKISPKREWDIREPNFEGFVKIIIGQSLSNKAAETIFERVKKLYPNLLISEMLTVKIHNNKFYNCGISKSKTEYIKNLANHCVQNKFFFNELTQKSDKEVIHELTKLKGIGIWSASIFCLFHLNRKNIFVIKDVSLKKAVEKLYFNDKSFSNEEIDKYISKWAPYNSTVCKLLWQYVDMGMPEIKIK